MVAKLLPSGHSETTDECPDCSGMGYHDPEPEAPKPVVTKNGVPLPRSSAFHTLAQILTGQKQFEDLPWDTFRLMSRMSSDNWEFHAFNVENDPMAWDLDPDPDHAYSHAKGNSVFPHNSTIVGNSYRGLEERDGLATKGAGNRVLVIPEPGNVHDKHALAVVVAKSKPDSRSGFTWVHVGYIPRDEAKELAQVWPKFKGRLLVGEGRFVSSPRDDGNVRSPRIVLEPSFRNYFARS